MESIDDFERRLAREEEHDPDCFDPEIFACQTPKGYIAPVGEAMLVLARENTRVTREAKGQWFPRAGAIAMRCAARVAVGFMTTMNPGLGHSFEREYGDQVVEPYTGIFSRRTPFDR